MNKLYVSSYAATKIATYRALTDLECTGFAVFDADANIIDFRMVKHKASSVSIEFEKEDIDAYVMQQAKRGNTKRIITCWWHTHPSGPNPSGVDEAMFLEMQESQDISIMLIFAKSGFYARVALKRDGFTMEAVHEVTIDYTLPWPDEPECPAKWAEDLETLCIKEVAVSFTKYSKSRNSYLPRHANSAYGSRDVIDLEEIKEEKDIPGLREIDVAFFDYMDFFKERGEKFVDGAEYAWDILIMGYEEDPSVEAENPTVAAGYASGAARIAKHYEKFLYENQFNITPKE